MPKHAMQHLLISVAHVNTYMYVNINPSTYTCLSVRSCVCVYSKYSITMTSLTWLLATSVSVLHVCGMRVCVLMCIYVFAIVYETVHCFWYNTNVVAMHISLQPNVSCIHVQSKKPGKVTFILDCGTPDLLPNAIMAMGVLMRSSLSCHCITETARHGKSSCKAPQSKMAKEHKDTTKSYKGQSTRERWAILRSRLDHQPLHLPFLFLPSNTAYAKTGLGTFKILCMVRRLKAATL
jgi:hypothetical protein